MSIVIVILALSLVSLTYHYIRQRIEDKENEELNKQTKKVYKKVQRSIVIADRNDVMPNLSDTITCNYIGCLEKYKELPQNGDVGMYNGEYYVFLEGKWYLMNPIINTLL